MGIHSMVKWRLRVIMADRDISIRDLAKKSGFHSNTIAKWRKADEQPRISGPEIDKLCDALDCTHLDLVGEGAY